MRNPATVTEARNAGLSTLASDDRMVAVYYALPFGEVAVTRDGSVYLADEYNAGKVGH